MSSRRKFRAAAGLIVPAVVFFTAGSPLLAQSEDSPAAVNPAPAPETGESAVFDAPGMPGVRMMAPRPDAPATPPTEAMQPVTEPVPQSTIVPGASMVIPALPSVTSATQDAAGAVFNAPNMPGVRMMAPIPDSQPVVTSPVAATPAIPTAARTAPAAATAGRRLAGGSDPCRRQGRRVVPRPAPGRRERKPSGGAARRVALSHRWRQRRELCADQRVPECASELAAARHAAHARRRGDADRYRSEIGDRVVWRPHAIDGERNDTPRRSASGVGQSGSCRTIDPHCVERRGFQRAGRDRHPPDAREHLARCRSSRAAGSTAFGRRHRSGAAPDRPRRRGVPGASPMHGFA